MKISFSTAALAVALTMGFCVPAPAHMGTVGGGMAAGSAHANVGLHGHGFGFHHFLPRPTNQFHRPHFRFAGFGSHRVASVAGGYGDYDEAYDDDIGNLHFRVQEPFGPGDIGRPPVRAEADAPYDSERMKPWDGYGPGEW